CLLLLPSSVCPLSSASFPTRRSSDLLWLTREARNCDVVDRSPLFIARRSSAPFPTSYRPAPRALLQLLSCSGQAVRHVPGCLRSDRKSTRLNSSHEWISYAVFCLKQK